MCSKPNHSAPITAKLTVVGDGHVGKTCLLHVYAKKEFPRKYVPTVFDNFSEPLTLDGVEYDLKLWDTAGQEDYERLRPLSYTGTNCFVVCYSIASRDSYENVASKWAPEVRHHKPNTPIVLVATKCDHRETEDPNEPNVTTKEGHKMKKKIKAAAYLECSALKNEGVDEVIHAGVRHSRATPKPCQRTCAIL